MMLRIASDNPCLGLASLVRSSPQFQDMRKQERDQQKLKKKLELLQRERDLFYREKERLQKGNELLLAERNQLLEERQGGMHLEYVCLQFAFQPSLRT